MLDTNAGRFDIAEVVRACRRAPARSVRWNGVTVAFDEERERIVLDEWVSLVVHRVLVPLPSGGIVRGPVLVECPRRCGRRARVLWSHHRDGRLSVACRACALVRYATAATRSEAERARIAYERLRARLGLTRPWQTFERTPYQRRRTYARLAARLAEARRRCDAASRAS